jgi:hypothetical protein
MPEDGARHAQFHEETPPAERPVLDDAGVTDWLRKRVRDALRTVAVHDGRIQEYLYIHSSVRAGYESSLFEDTAKTVAAEHKPGDEALTSLCALGPVRYTATEFERWGVLRTAVAADRQASLTCSVDTEAEFDLREPGRGLAEFSPTPRERTED